MMHLTLKDFSSLLKGKLVNQENPEEQIKGFSLDTRTLKPQDLFIAVEGNNIDGNHFAQQALEKGAVGILSEKDGPGPRILVKNIVDSLSVFGRTIRKDFKGPIIGITGSNGKTSTKELVAAALSAKGPVLKNKGNQNSEYTSPLVWANLEPNHWAAVIEMGMRGFGQIRHLASIAQPNIALITLIGSAHAEIVHSQEGILKAKAEILENLPNDGTAILWAEDSFFSELKKKSPCKVLSFGWSENAECRLLGYKSINWEKSLLRGILRGEHFECEIPIVGRHQALNATAAMAAAFAAGVPLQEAAKNLIHTEFPPLRMEIRSYKGVTILLDSYNAAPESVIAALESLSEIPAQGDRYAILGEMRELGEYTEAAHRKIGAAITQAAPKHTLLYGDLMRYSKEEALLTGYHQSSLSLAKSIKDVQSFLNNLKPGDIVLMKASRSIGLETALEEIS